MKTKEQWEEEFYKRFIVPVLINDVSITVNTKELKEFIRATREQAKKESREEIYKIISGYTEEEIISNI
jgi:hypothetical protein